MMTSKEAYCGKSYKDLDRWERLWCDIVDVKGVSEESYGVTLKDIPKDYADTMSLFFSIFEYYYKCNYLERCEFKIITSRYDTTYNSFEQIGKTFKITRGRAEQIVKKELRMLRSICRKLRLEEALVKGISYCESNGIKVREILNNEISVLTNSVDDDISSLQDLPKRIQFSLLRGNIRSYEQLKSKSDEELLSLRSIGQKKLIEIKNYIKEKEG